MLEEVYLLKELPADVKALVFADDTDPLRAGRAGGMQKGFVQRANCAGDGLLKASTVQRSGKVVMFSALPAVALLERVKFSNASYIAMTSLR